MLKNVITGLDFVNPTGGKIRVDNEGSGYYGAARGSREHDGVDFECCPGQNVLMPVDGQIVRYSYPYAKYLEWQGVKIISSKIDIFLWYMQPYHEPGNWFNAGDIIGFAQDISKKYEGMLPHIHMRIAKIDPLILFKEKTNE